MSALDSILRDSFQKFLRFSDDLHEMNNYLSDIRTCFLALTLAVYLAMIFYIISICYQRLRNNNNNHSRHQSGSATANDIRQYSANKSDEEAMIIDKWTAVSTQNRHNDHRSPGYGYHNTIRSRSTVNPPMDLHSSGPSDRYHHHHHQPSTAKMLAARAQAAAQAANEPPLAPPAVVVSSASPQSSPSTPPQQMTAGSGTDSPPMVINKENGELMSMMVNVDQHHV